MHDPTGTYHQTRAVVATVVAVAAIACALFVAYDAWKAPANLERQAEIFPVVDQKMHEDADRVVTVGLLATIGLGALGALAAFVALRELAALQDIVEPSDDTIPHLRPHPRGYRSSAGSAASSTRSTQVAPATWRGT